MMTRLFRDKIGHMVEVYIDDMIVKSKQEGRHIEDLQVTFEVLRQHKLRLNVEKCVDAEMRYLPLEKLVLALVHATRKLPQYF